MQSPPRIGLEAWSALASPDPRALAAIARTGTPALPLLGNARHRHLRELPSVENGLSLTEALALALLAKEALSLDGIFRALTSAVDPPPRWVGGVEIRPGAADWRWNEQLRDAVRG